MKVIIDIVGPDGRDPTPRHFDDHIAALQNAFGINEVRRADIISILRGLRWVLQNELMNETFNKPSVADRSKPPLKLAEPLCRYYKSDCDEITMYLHVDHITRLAGPFAFTGSFKSAVDETLRLIERIHGLRIPGDDPRRFRFTGTYGHPDLTLEYSGPAFPCVIEGENVWPIRSPVSFDATTPSEGMLK